MLKFPTSEYCSYVNFVFMQGLNPGPCAYQTHALSKHQPSNGKAAHKLRQIVEAAAVATLNKTPKFCDPLSVHDFS
uniref:Uncharacterized protein n=1 Tax=Romanomermis culicivorax TaxID=13658 RepID=A0A915I9Z8_ROMCU